MLGDLSSFDYSAASITAPTGNGGTTSLDAVDSLSDEDLEILARSYKKHLARFPSSGLSERDLRTKEHLSQVSAFFDRSKDVPRFKAKDWGVSKDTAADLQRTLWFLENDMAKGVSVKVQFDWDSHFRNADKQAGANATFVTLLSKFLDELESRKNKFGSLADQSVPIEQLFTMNESVNNEATEYLYRCARVVSGEDPKTLFPIRDYDKPKLRPRHDQVPGQNAGVLSAPMMMYASDALRGVMRNYYEYLWCTGTARSNGETEAVLALQKGDLRVGDGWKELASMNICTDCHARLDYGMQFFWGYPSSTMGTDFNVGSVRAGKGPLYGNNIKDERGQADQNPRGLAELATAQPEFGACMTRKIVDDVYNGTENYDDFKAIRETFSATHRVKPTLKAAMSRYAQREFTSPTPTTPRPAKPPVEAPWCTPLLSALMVQVSP